VVVGVNLISVLFKILCDGSDFFGRGSGAGVYIEKMVQSTPEHFLPAARFVVPLPAESTNNEAEYHAVIAALRYLGDELAQVDGVVSGRGRVDIYSDSQLIVRQLNGDYRVREPRLKALYDWVNLLAGQLAEQYEIHFIHLPRELNAEADHLARIASMLSPLHSNG
jgi:ribonuclease HI